MLFTILASKGKYLLWFWVLCVTGSDILASSFLVCCSIRRFRTLKKLLWEIINVMFFNKQNYFSITMQVIALPVKEVFEGRKCLFLTCSWQPSNGNCFYWPIKFYNVLATPVESTPYDASKLNRSYRKVSKTLCRKIAQCKLYWVVTFLMQIFSSVITSNVSSSWGNHCD